MIGILDIVDEGLVNENDIIHEGPVPLIQADHEAESTHSPTQISNI